MDVSNLKTRLIPRQHLLPLISGMFILLLLFYMGLQRSSLLLALLVGILITNYLPIAAVLILFIAGVLQDYFVTTPIHLEDYLVIGGGFNAVDVVLLLMACAIVLRLVHRRKVKQQDKLGIWPYIGFLGLLILFEILRNVGTYGLNAPGEFRYRYMILVLPVYISLFFPSQLERKKFFKLLIFLSVFFTLIFVPIIGQFKGWSVGEGSRFLPADISLGLVYGLTALFLARRYRFFSFSYFFVWLTAVPVFYMVVIDGHRSVWMATVVIFFSLILLKEIRLSKMWAWGTAVVLALVVVWHLVGTAGLNVPEYLKERGVAFLDPQADATAGWRLDLWTAQMEKFLNSPILGEGFGGYWGVYSAKMGGVVDVSPHSLYVQTLIKLGILGMLLYLVIVFKIFLRLKTWIVKQTRTNPESAIVITALVVLVAGHAFYYVYSFEYYTWFFVSIGIAALKDRNTFCPRT